MDAIAIAGTTPAVTPFQPISVNKAPEPNAAGDRRLFSWDCLVDFRFPRFPEVRQRRELAASDHCPVKVWF